MIDDVQPPKWALALLRSICPNQLYEEIEGDLIQKFNRDVKRLGEAKAKRRLVWNVVRFFRPEIVLRNKISMDLFNITLLGNYFKISYRYLARNKTFAVVNVLGLALGMASALLIYKYVRAERSYDTFHKAAANIYRVTTEWNASLTPQDKRATTVPWSGPGVKEAFPEVIEYTRFAPLATMTGNNSVHYKGKEIDENRIYLVDPGFLKIFSFPLFEGDDRSALSNPHQIIVTESIARKYFGNESPLGKSLFIDTHENLTGNDYKVTGVIGDPPLNSHMSFDFLISYPSMWAGLNNGSTYWHWDNTYCYLLLRPDADVRLLERKISDLRVKQFGNEMGGWNDIIEFKLQPVKDIHLFSFLKGEISLNGDGRSLHFLVVVGISILLSAYINYINLSTVKAVERRIEIGIRKVVGSSKVQLSFQLVVESVVINIMALILAVAIAGISGPVLENLFNIQWPEVDLGFPPTSFLLGVLGLVTAGTLLSALYPAFVMTSLKPAEALKGRKPASIGGGNRWTLRRSLTVLQFIFCIVFTIGTFVLYQQLKFMKNHDLGMNMDKVIAVKAYGFQQYSSYKSFKAKLSSSSLISSVGSSSAAPGDEIVMLGLRPKVSVGEKADLTELKMISVDEDFFKTLNVEFIAGRNFDPSSKTESDAVILNETAAKLLGYEDPVKIVNQRLKHLRQTENEVIGVIKNYHQLSLKNSLEPIVFVPNFVPNWIPENNLGWNKFYYFVRLNSAIQYEDITQVITEMERAWNASAAKHPFSYFFLDSYFDNNYRSDTTFSSLFLFFSSFAIFIACLGLFGLVAYTTLQRTKEIGIRKVLGASVQNILMLVSKDFVKLIVIAAVVAIPLVGFGLQEWLESYAFRIRMEVWLFAYPLLLIFILAYVTVVLKSIKVAVANPVESIRYE